MIDNKGYRKNVGIVLMNNKNQFLIFKRIGADAWQFPQGGIDKNETLERALYRELFEETGLTKKDVIFIGKTKKWITYDLPEKYQKKRNGKLLDKLQYIAVFGIIFLLISIIIQIIIMRSGIF